MSWPLILEFWVNNTIIPDDDFTQKIFDRMALFLSLSNIPSPQVRNSWISVTLTILETFKRHLFILYVKSNGTEDKPSLSNSSQYEEKLYLFFTQIMQQLRVNNNNNYYYY